MDICKKAQFPQNVHTRKLGEITVLYTIIATKELVSIDKTPKFMLTEKTSFGNFLMPRFFRGMLIMEDINQVKNHQTSVSTTIDNYQNKNYYKNVHDWLAQPLHITQTKKK